MNNTTFDRDVHPEGKVAKAIESKTADLPSDLFLWVAGGAIVASAALQVLGVGQKMRVGRFSRMMGAGSPPVLQRLSLFVGQWAPTILMLGLYNKIVKVAGSDRYSSSRY